MRVRVVEPHATVTRSDPPTSRPVVRAEVLDVLLGGPPTGAEVAFAQHGHGVPVYANGDEALIFLQRLDRVGELAETPLRGLLDWVSRQEEGAKLILTEATRDAFTAAVRSYAALREMPRGDERQEAARRVTVDLLGSPEPALAASALRDVVTASEAPVITAADVPRLRRLIEGGPSISSRPIAFRVGLLAELERRRLVDAPALWSHLLQETDDADRLVVLQTLAAKPRAELTTDLIAIVDERPSVEIAAAATVALGAPGNERAVPTLRRVLADEHPRLRSSAVRALGNIGTPSAREAIELAAHFQPDDDTRRRARAQASLLHSEGETR